MRIEYILTWTKAEKPPWAHDQARQERQLAELRGLWDGTHDSRRRPCPLPASASAFGWRASARRQASGIAGQGGTDGAEQREASEMVARDLRWLGQARLGRGFKVY